MRKPRSTARCKFFSAGKRGRPRLRRSRNNSIIRKFCRPISMIRGSRWIWAWSRDWSWAHRNFKEGDEDAMSYKCCEGVRGLKFSRRYFLKQGGVALVGLSAMPAFLQRAVAATPLTHKNQLAIVHAAGSPEPTRSHFDAQDFMESGTPGLKSTEDGWLNRALETVPEEEASPFRAVAMGPNLPRMLHGVAPAIALPDLKQFKVMAQTPGTGQMVEGGFEAMYSQTVDHALHGTGTETFEAIDLLRKADPGKYQPQNGAQYPTSRLGQSLQQIGQLLKADIGVEVLFVDCGGWDNHVNEGGVQGQLSNLLKDLGQGLAAFHQDMGDRMQNIVVVTMSEFGRTAKENGNRGTDHGHA